MSAARTERLLNLLTLLLNARRAVSLREIRELEEFEAYRTSDPKSGERAFERDKAALIELGVPLRWVPPERDDDEDGVGGYVIDRDAYYLPELDLEPGELALLSIAGAAAAGMAGFPGRVAVIRALAKLGFDVDEMHQPRTLAHAPVLEGIDAERLGRHLDVLHDAVSCQRRVRLVYAAPGREPTAREVDPYGLYYREGIWYLVGHCHLRRAERTFHLGRVVEVKPLRAERVGGDFTVPQGFELSEHARRRPWEFPQEPPVEVTIRMAPRLVPAIPEIFGRNAVLEERAEGPVVRLTVSHRAALIAAVLPYGAAAEVLAPEDVRTELRRIYEELSARYRPRARAEAREDAR